MQRKEKHMCYILVDFLFLSSTFADYNQDICSFFLFFAQSVRYKLISV